MNFFTNEDLIFRDRVIDFLKSEITPFVDSFDDMQMIPHDIFAKLSNEGFLSSVIPEKFGGNDFSYTKLAILHDEFGQVFPSLENAITVFGMVAKPILKLGTSEQKSKWLPMICSGKYIFSIALTEPKVGSDLYNIETSARFDGNNYILNGIKKYITLGEIADYFLVLAKVDDRLTTFIVDRKLSGINIKAIKNTLSLRSNMLAEISFENCVIDPSCIIGKVGDGLSASIALSLDEGRFTTALGALGLAKTLLNQSLAYSKNRVQARTEIINHQLISKILTEMISQTKLCNNFCFNLAKSRDANSSFSISDTFIAKYSSANCAIDNASKSMQICGASSITNDSKIERFFRDSRAMIIIEGTPQLFEINIPFLFQGF